MRFLPAFLASLLVLAIACTGDDDDDAPATQAPTSVANATPEATSETTPAQAGVTSESTAEAQTPEPQALPGSVSLERVFPQQSFERLTGMHQLPSGSWLVTEQAGRLWIMDEAGQESRVLLDLRDRVSDAGSEEGLLGLAVAPDFAQSGEIYLYYSAAGPRRSVIARFHLEPSGTSDPDINEIILEVTQPFPNHNGGQIAFGPDGFLYVGVGDGGSGRDPDRNGQNVETLLGSILRIDVSSGDPGYSVPSDNPFVGRGNARGEIWAYGLRNPWRFSFDASTGDLWAGDVGESAREEVDRIVAGGNYGWAIMEGAECLGGGDDCDQDGLIPPVIDYSGASGPHCSVTGGFVYRGSIASLQGAYVYSDFCSGTIWAVRHDGESVIAEGVIAESGVNVSSFAQGNDLEVYVLEHSPAGGIYRLVP